mmetsp:Transcript_18130/g.42678  ORF Transcript_18130/g.42678 Transcript_18130/m.42678 type:complete len:700 (-) Transcript_18130:550-2649(-)|eukprot:CAMPEP_0171108888 /NCGR_PEP_ID=MMETSP0766_2-20121228/69801_1 /TAXON_ID=439317 /ORGANISM="Gambierdiscus australes, Strain CAWD 149" /LENGTH=699 /DNA_ID=CAMNT_0011570505 /DNA_START=47 /DNA_END=2146 /DNA_ORIENTATION=+
MKCAQALAYLLLACAWLLDAANVQENPLGEVLTLLDSLAAKITKEGEAEAKAYKEFLAWCDDAARNKKFEITTATSKQEKLEAAISKSATDADASSAKIEDLAGSLASADAELKSASAIRGKEAADFAKSEAELLDVIDTLGRATAVLEREMAKNPAAFAQTDTSNLRALMSSLSAVVDAAAFSTADKQKLLSLVQSQQNSADDMDDLGAPAAAVYKTHSTSIVDVLEDLKEKAEEQLSDLRKAESNAKHNYDMLKQSLDDQSSADSKDLADEKSAKAESEGAKANAEGDLAATVKDLADAKGALQLANTNCMQTAADHDATVKARKEELKAIAEAKQILQDTTAGAVDQTYSLLQVQAESQLRTRADLARAEVIELVRKLAKQHHSAALAQLASRIAAVMQFGAAAGEDPFAKVKGLISDLIEKLEAEAGGEVTEKAYCDEQMAKTEVKKGELEQDISRLTSKIDMAAAKAAGLKASVKELQEELANLAQEQAEMDRMRQESHADYVQAKADLEQGLAGVRSALRILREYYGGAALLQGAAVQPDLPELHKKATGAGQSIIGILEVVESDFAKGLAAEETQEDGAAALYERTTQANAITKTLKDQDVKYNTQEIKSLEKSLSELTGDRDAADAELSAVLDYYSKIKARCIAKPETYEERKRRREAEIKGLKEALAILEDETALVQRGKRGLRSHRVDQ